MSLTDLIPGATEARGAILAAVAIGTLAVGAGLAEAYEHIAPWGSVHELSSLTKSLPARDAERYSAGAAGQKSLDEGVVDSQWRPALAACQAQRTQGSSTAAASIDAERDASRRSSDAAYQLGRASCTGVTTSGKTSSSGPAAASGSVRPSGADLRDIVSASLSAAS